MEHKGIFAHCEICKCSYEVSTLLQNSRNDFFCKDCFKRSLCSGSKAHGAGDTKCRTYSPKVPKEVRCRKLVPRPEIYVQKKPHTLLGNQSTASIMSLSKRPLQCPKADCSKFISVRTFEAHFRTEHKEVPVVSTHLDARCASEFYLRDLRYSIIQCIALLKVINPELLNGFRQSKLNISGNRLEDPKPVMILMSTRISSVHLREDDEEIETEEKHANSVKHHDEEVFRPEDRIIVWVASNVATNLSYTVAVSTLDNEIRQKFFGPMPTLDDHPEKLCRHGNCLILTNLHCKGMSENGTKPLALDVVIHGPD